MRSFSAQAPGLAALARGGMRVARCSTALLPATAAAIDAALNRSPRTGWAPSRSSSASFEAERASARTRCPSATSRRTTGRPSTPVAPVTNTSIRRLRMLGRLPSNAERFVHPGDGGKLGGPKRMPGGTVAPGGRIGGADGFRCESHGGSPYGRPAHRWHVGAAFAGRTCRSVSEKNRERRIPHGRQARTTPEVDPPAGDAAPRPHPQIRRQEAVSAGAARAERRRRARAPQGERVRPPVCARSRSCG